MEARTNTVLAMDLYELPFDQFQRYKSVEEIVALLRDGKTLKILDVGGHPGLISHFLPEEDAYVLDIIPCNLPNYIQGDGTSLPFNTETFDVVTSLDVYEHIPADKREVFIDEICRISKDLIILSAPFQNQDVELAERILYDYVVRVFGEFPTLREHINYGLPSLEELIIQLEKKGMPVISFPSGQLYNWLIMMLAKHYVTAVLNSENIQRELDKLYNLNFSYQDYGVPSYRQVIVSSKISGRNFLREVSKKFKPVRPKSEELGLKIQLFQMLVNLLELQMSQQIAAKDAHISSLEEKLNDLRKERRAWNKEIEKLTQQLKGKDEVINSIFEETQLDKQHIANLEYFVEKVKRSWPYRFYSFWKNIGS